MTNNIFTDFLIGNTPLVELKETEKFYGLKAKLFAKLEWNNLTGSVKDRTALQILLDAKENGLKQGSLVIEATSGNTGISLAGICNKLGYKAVIVMPENMSDERKMLIKALGAELVLTPKEGGMKEAVRKADEIYAQNEGSFKSLQFENPSNAKAHYLTTGPEIYEQLNGQVDAFTTGIGTGGTLCGIAKFLKEKNPQVKIVGAEPASSPLLTKGIAGAHKIQGIGANFIPSLYNPKVVDEVVDITDEEAFDYARKVTKLEGFTVGISSGASLCSAVKICKLQEMFGKNVVTLFPDSGIKYLSTELYK